MNKLIVFSISILAVSFLGTGCVAPSAKNIDEEGTNIPAAVSVGTADWTAAKAVVENKLSGWVAFQKAADPAFSLDEFNPGGTASVQGEALPADPREFDATRSRFQTVSPNGKLLLDPYAYYDLFQKDGSMYFVRDVDSAVRVLDPVKKTSWQVLMCGTPCTFDAAAWVNDHTVVEVGTAEADGAGVAHEIVVWLIDLDKKSISTFNRPAPKRPGDYFRAAFTDIKQ